MSEVATEEALVCLDAFYRAELVKAGKVPVEVPSKRQCDTRRVLGNQAFPYCGLGQILAYNRSAYPLAAQLHARKKAEGQARVAAARDAAIEAEVRRWMALTPEQKEAEIYRKQLAAMERARQERERQVHLCRANAYLAPTRTGSFGESATRAAKCDANPNYDAYEEMRSRCGYKTVTGRYNMVDHGRLGTWTEKLYVCE